MTTASASKLGFAAAILCLSARSGLPQANHCTPTHSIVDQNLYCFTPCDPVSYLFL